MVETGEGWVEGIGDSARDSRIKGSRPGGTLDAGDNVVVAVVGSLEGSTGFGWLISC